MIPPTLDLVRVSEIFMLSWTDSPDSLEDNKTTSDLVRGDLHDVDLADDSRRIVRSILSIRKC